MKYLITGSFGQLAKAFLSYFEKNGIDYFAADKDDLDITDKHQISDAVCSYKPDVIINCAAYNNVDMAEKEESLPYLINKTAVSYLVEEAEKIKAKFVHFSTDYVFDGKKNDFYTEEDIPNPLNVYAKTKFAGEIRSLEYERALVFRLSWVIGYGSQNFLYKFSNWAKQYKTIKVSSDEISVPSFTFDIAKCVLSALDKDLTGLYHLTNSSKASRYELAVNYANLMGYSNEILPVPMASFKSQAQRPLFTAMSNAKISKELGIKIPDWRQSLEQFVNTLKADEHK